MSYVYCHVCGGTEQLAACSCDPYGPLWICDDCAGSSAEERDGMSETDWYCKQCDGTGILGETGYTASCLLCGGTGKEQRINVKDVCGLDSPCDAEARIDAALALLEGEGCCHEIIDNAIAALKGETE
jgi:hypothetical protein